MPRLLLLILSVVLIWFPDPARADIVATTTVAPGEIGSMSSGPYPVPPECQDTAVGAVSASAFIACEAVGISFSAVAEAKVGIGPFGIGAAWSVFGGTSVSAPFGNPVTVSTVEISWSQQFMLTGASGSGFFEPSFKVGSYPAACEISLCTLYISMPGDVLFSLASAPALGVPAVTFDVPFTITMEGEDRCIGGSGSDNFGCGSGEVELSDFTVLDANGNAISGVSLVALPEPSSLSLLGVALVLLMLCWARHRCRNRRLVRKMNDAAGRAVPVQIQ